MEKHTLDEVIARNVTRLREAKSWTVADLADALRVGRHLVYDYERPRKGSAQRQFTWQDLVKLCVVLETTLFEMVLPDEGVQLVEVSHPPTETTFVRNLDSSDMPDLADRLRSVHALDNDDRSTLAWWLFGLRADDLSPEMMRQFVDFRKGEGKRRSDLVAEIAEEMQRRLEEEEERNETTGTR